MPRGMFLFPSLKFSPNSIYNLFPSTLLICKFIFSAERKSHGSEWLFLRFEAMMFRSKISSQQCLPLEWSTEVLGSGMELGVWVDQGSAIHSGSVWTGSANGSCSFCLYTYLFFILAFSEYPVQRSKKDSEGVEMGVAGSVSLLQNVTLSTQPISSLDWSPDKRGLCICSSFDQMVRVLIITKLHKI